MTIGILLIQVGTPDAPTAPALRRYLRQFLGDPRVIDLPRWKWRLILNLFILPFRPARSAAKYRRIWDPKTGSPLLHYTRRQAEELQRLLPGATVRVRDAGRPAVRGVGGAWDDCEGRRTADRLADVPAILGHDHGRGDGRAFSGADEGEARAGPARRAALLRPPRLPRRHDDGDPRGAGPAGVARRTTSCSVFTESRSAIASRATPTPRRSSGRRPGWWKG